jgi:hypothetical protein
MIRIIRTLLPRTYRRILAIGWEQGRQYQIALQSKRHPRAKNGQWAEKK